MTDPDAPSLPALSDALLRWAPPPRKLRYARCGNAGSFELPRVIFEESWADAEARDGRRCYRRITRQLGADGQGRIVEDAVVAYGPEGLVDLGVYADGALSLYDPPQVVLPPEPAAGLKWEAEHRRGDRVSKRRCELIRCPDHKRCLVVVADIRRQDGALVLRSHYRQGEGWTGYEALVQAPGRPSVRTWTEALTVTTRAAEGPRG